MAQQQTDFVRLATCLAGASQEISRLPNVPAIDMARLVVERMEALTRRMDEQFRRMDERMDEQSRRMDEQSRRMDEQSRRMETNMNNQFRNLHRRLDASERNHSARLFNSHISSRETLYHILHDRNNEPVAEFPANASAVASLSSNALTNLLNAYGLPTDGNVEVKRRRFKHHIGVVVET